MKKYKFEEIAINCTSKRLPQAEDYSKYIGLEHMDTGSIHVKRWGSDVPIVGEKLIMQKGDVLLGKRNAYLRRAAIAPFDGLFSAHGMVLKPKKDVVDERFFPLFIASDYFFDEAIRISVGSLSPTINWKDLKDIEFSLPDITTQQKIAEILWKAQESKDKYEEMLFLTDELVKSQFIEMFGDPIVNNKGWRTQSLKEVAPEYSPTIPTADTYWWLNLDMIETYTGQIIKKIIVPLSEIGSSTSTFDNTMVLYSKLRPYLNKVVVPDDNGYATTELVGLKPNEKILNKYFLFNLLRSNEFVSYATGIAGGSQMPRMPINRLRDFKCIAPPIELQEQFARFVEQTDKSKYIVLTYNNLAFIITILILCIQILIENVIINMEDHIYAF